MVLIITLSLMAAVVIAIAPACSGAGQGYQNPCATTLSAKPIFDETKFVTYPSYSIASSPPRLRNLAENEEIIYILIKNFYTIFRPRPVDIIEELKPLTLPALKLMRSYITDFEITSGSLQLTLKRQKTEDPININSRAFRTVWNPLTTYFMLRRVLNTLKEIIRNLDPTKEPEFTLQNQILHLMKAGGWPVDDDIKSALSAILRIQHVYDLSTYEISAGKLAGFETNLNLSAEDCVEMGEEALIEEGGVHRYYALAVEWFEEARRRQLREGISSRKFQAEIDNYLRYAIELHDEEWSSDSEIRDTYFFTSRCKHSKSLLRRVRRRTAELAALKSGNALNSNVKKELQYWGTCSGQNYQSDSDRAKLFCWYETEVNPYHKINPLKVELLSIEPHPIIQYYDMIGDKMISRIKCETGHQLSQSSVYNKNARPIWSSILRASSSSSIVDNKESEFRSIPQTIEAATGLSVGCGLTSKRLHVAAYTSGGHYTLHLDAWPKLAEEMLPEDKKTFSDGNRIATFMFYLTDVEAGGGTSFPQSGIAAQPIKGSAVLWFSLMRNGEVDTSTWHGGCPVIIGEKWIANKWIMSNDQMFRKDYQCVQDQEARFRPRINTKNLMDLV